MEAAIEGLIFDAHISQEDIKSSQLTQQPVNLWYGSESRQYAGGKLCYYGSEGTDPMAVEVWIPSGKRTTVAILDSGINTSHKTFSNGIKFSKFSSSFVGGDYDDILGHGTHCAGILCGSEDDIPLYSGDTVPFVGIATDTKVMVCKVVKDGTEIADIGAVCNAIDYIMDHNKKHPEGDRVNVISMSFGMPWFNHALTKKIQEALCDDIIVVCAASNDGCKSSQTITYPARLGNVLCIGACSYNGKPTDFSPVGRELDFLAPGKNIWAPQAGNKTGYELVYGTSFSAPLVAGIVCQIIEDLKRLDASVPGVSAAMHNVWCMRELLKKMARVQGNHSEERGFGSLNPKDYFVLPDIEKFRIIKSIIGLR